MCGDCDAEEWEEVGITPAAFLASLPDGRARYVERAYRTIRGAASGDDYWQGGSLHVQVDDNNYDIDWDGVDLWWGQPWARKDDPADMPTLVDEVAAGRAWNGLRYLERVLVVGWLWRYWPDIPPPVVT